MAPRIYRSMPTGIGLHFTDEFPLGPVAAELIKDHSVSAFLFNPETESFRGVMNGASIILGRRGAGKSALLHTLNDRTRLRQHLSDHYSDSTFVRGLGLRTELEKDYLLTVNIDAPYEMAEVDRIIRQRSFYTLEASADAWRRRIMHNILLHLVNNRHLSQKLPQPIRGLIGDIAEVIHGRPNERLRINELLSAVREAHKNRDHVLNHLEDGLKAARRRVLVLVDTMEEYRIRDSAVRDVVSGLLYEIGRHAGNGEVIEIKAALPTEIYKTVKDAGAPGRYALPTEFIHWHPSSLICLCAHRAMIMAKVRELGKFERLCNLMPRDTSTLDVKLASKILEEFFGNKAENEAGQEEEPVNILLRHTLLLPRQLINIMAFAFRASIRDGGRLSISRQHLKEALDRGAERVIDEVFASYRHVYPDISTVAPPFARHCSLQNSYGELQRAFNQTVRGRHHHDYVEDFPTFLEALIDCGLLGIKGRVTQRYVEGYFAYNVSGPLSYTEKDLFVLHPSALRHYRVTPSLEGRVVMPAGSQVDAL